MTEMILLRSFDEMIGVFAQDNKLEFEGSDSMLYAVDKALQGDTLHPHGTDMGLLEDLDVAEAIQLLKNEAAA